MDIVAHPAKQLVRADLDDQVQVTSRSSLGPGIPLSRQTNPLSIPGSRLDAELQRLLPRHHSRAIAGVTRVLNLA